MDFDSYIDPSLLYPFDEDQHDAINAAVEHMLQVVHDNGLPITPRKTLQNIVYDHIDVVGDGSSHVPSARIIALKIELFKEASPVKVEIRNYTSDRRLLLQEMTSRLVNAGMEYRNPAARGASAVLGICLRLRLRLHPDKCTLYALDIRWCGKIVYAGGWKYDPRKVEGLHSMQAPTTGYELQKFLCALQWMRTAIPNFLSLVQALQDFLERVCTEAEERTKRSVNWIHLDDIGWGDEHKSSFRVCQHALAHHVTLSHRNIAHRIVLYTDACEDN